LIQRNLLRYLDTVRTSAVAVRAFDGRGGRVDGLRGELACTGGRTDRHTPDPAGALFITCSPAMLAAQPTLPLSLMRRRIDHHWVAAAFAGSALALVLTSWVPGARSPWG